jgi:hypothetical protein
VTVDHEVDVAEEITSADEGDLYDPVVCGGEAASLVLRRTYLGPLGALSSRHPV